jgi:integrase
LAKLKINITHVKWRGGRPRFEPGPKVRALGFKGEDLRYGPSGAWFDPSEALAWSQAKEREIEARRADAKKAAAAGKRLKRLRAPGPSRTFLSVEELFEVYFDSSRLKGKEVEDGRRKQKPLAPATAKDYKNKADTLGKFDPQIYTAPVNSLTKPIVYDLYERIWSKHGLAMARGSIAVLSAAISWGLKRGRVIPDHRFPGNPCTGLAMETPEPRLRALTPDEVRHLVSTADALERPEIGDAIIMGVWTGQRQKDRLALMDGGLFDGRRLFRQSKTKAIVEIRQAPELEQRLARAKERRADWKVLPAHILVDEKMREPFKGDHYRHLFEKVRTAAVAGIDDKIAPMPSLADARDQDLRDTAVTWLARAGCTHMEIAQITGHSMQSIQTILKHYLAHHREIADNAIAKLVAWYDGQGAQG